MSEIIGKIHVKVNNGQRVMHYPHRGSSVCCKLTLGQSGRSLTTLSASSRASLNLSKQAKAWERLLNNRWSCLAEERKSDKKLKLIAK